MKKVIFVLLFLPLFFTFPQSALAISCPGPCPSDYLCNADSGRCVFVGGGGAGSVSPDNWHGCPAVSTALGPIPTEPECLVKWVLTYAILMGGGIAFLLSVFGGVSIILAGGNPEKINSGKEIIGSALTGLLFIIFSVFLLRFIGYDILQLPGFGK